MKKLLGVVLFLIVVKCYGISQKPNFKLEVPSSEEVPFEGGMSLLIACGIIYGARIGRHEPVED